MEKERNTSITFEDDTDHLDEFLPHLDDLLIPEDKQREFLETLWAIMVQFACLGFGADTASQAIAAQLGIAFEDAEPAPLKEAFEQGNTFHKNHSTQEAAE